MLPILKYPDQRLHQLCEPVTDFGPSLHGLLGAMAQTMYQSGGIGLAGPQVAAFQRVFLVDLGGVEGMPKQRFELINPMLFGGEGRIVFDEGCLSLVGVVVPVSRFARIQVRFQDRDGQPRHLHAEGLLAVAIQHENDHLDGILTLDRVPFWKRYFIRRQLKELAEKAGPTTWESS
jgi:peptide deformylase